jgi:hypothetical protein
VEANVDMEVDNVADNVNNRHTGDGELIDYNDEEVMAVLNQKAKRIEPRGAFAQKGLALRRVLLSEPIKAHYASPMAMKEMRT